MSTYSSSSGGIYSSVPSYPSYGGAIISCLILLYSVLESGRLNVCTANSVYDGLPVAVPCNLTIGCALPSSFNLLGRSIIYVPSIFARALKLSSRGTNGCCSLNFSRTSLSTDGAPLAVLFTIGNDNVPNKNLASC